MNYVDILRINHPTYVLTHAGDGTDYDALTWSIYNPSPNPIPKATLDAEIAAAVASNTGQLEDLTTNAEQELYALANMDESPGLIRKVSHASYILDNSAYITSITANNVTTALGFTPYDAANPQQYTTKSYVDSLATTGVVWVPPAHAFNFMGTASAPPSGTSYTNENYIIMTGGNTGVWASFQAGDRVSYQGGTWVFREQAHVGCRLGINFDKLGGALAGDAIGHQDYIGEITGGNPTDGYTWTWTAPTNHMSAFNNLSTSTKFGQTYTYDDGLGSWIPFSTSTYTGGNAITVTGTTIDVDYGAGLTIYNDTIAVLPYPTGGLMNTLDGNVSSNNKEAYLSLTKVGTAGTYKSVTTDAYGRITSGSNPDTLAGFGITDAVSQSMMGSPLGVATLDASSKLVATQLPTHTQQWSTITNTPTSIDGYGITDGVHTGQLGIASGIATLNANSVITTSQLPAYTGDVTKPAGSTVTTLATVNSNTGVFGSATQVSQVTVNSKGLVTAVANVDIPNTIALTGDGTASVTTGSSGALTLATVNTNTGVFGAATLVPRFTVNAKGLITAASNITIPNTIALTGDGTASVTTGSSGALTLATVNSNVGVFGDSNDIAQITVNAKGLITAVSNVAISASGIGAVSNAGGVISMQEGSLASRPAFGVSGRIYIATDRGLIYRDTGTSWDLIGIGNDGSGNGGIYQSITGTYGASSGTTIIPADATIPQNTEGTAIWTGTITPNSAGSKVRVSSSFWMDCNTNGRSVTVTLFRNGVCIQAQNSYFKNIGQPMQVALEFVDSPASATAITYMCRVGVNASATWYINQNSAGTITYGGAANTSTYVLMEIL